MQSVDLVSILVQAGAVGVVVLLSVIGWIAWKPGIDRMDRDAERWRQLYETERAAHDTTRKAHAEEDRPMLLAGVEAARTVEHLLTGLQRAGNQEPRS